MDFVLRQLPLSWQDIKWGYDHGWLSATGVVDYAIARAGEGYDESSTAVTLAGLSPRELAEVTALLYALAQNEENNDEAESMKKWLCLILTWVYGQRDQLPDPLGVVEELYADFNYPVEMRSFVRYMPTEDGYEPQAHSHEENIARLFKEWESYLQCCRVASQ